MTTEIKENGRACGACCTKLLNFGVKLGGNVILENINLHMHCGELTALIGPNGCGKTTLLRAILGEIPHSGEIQFMPFEQKRNRKPRIGYVPQRMAVDPLAPISVRDFFAGATSAWPLWLGRRQAEQESVLKALETVQAGRLIDEKLGRLSVGQLQRVLLALALSPEPDILLLDEPVAGIDLAGMKMFYDMISQLRLNYDLSILLVSHDLQAVAGVADRMIYLNRTVVCDGTPWDVLSDKRLREVFGLDVSVEDLPVFNKKNIHEMRTTNG